MPNNDLSDTKESFQAGVDSVYDAVGSKGSTPASKSLSDIIEAIGNIKIAVKGFELISMDFYNGRLGQSDNSITLQLKATDPSIKKIMLTARDTSYNFISALTNCTSSYSNRTTTITIKDSTQNFSFKLQVGSDGTKVGYYSIKIE